MPKNVEDILKEEGIIKPIPQEESRKVKFEDDRIDLKKIVMSVEKLQTEVETLRDFKKQNDEVTRELTEKIGEIRSLFFQRESLIKETETKVKTLDDIVSDINPTKYLKELDRRKEEILESQARIEKIELIEKDLLNGVNGLKQTLQNIKSVENLEKILNEIRDNVSKNRQLKDDIERTAGKTERFYFEMENSIKDFIGLKAKTDKIEDMSQELTKSVDSINIRLSGFISRNDIEDFKKSVNSIISSNREYIESKVKEIGSLLSLPSEEVAARVEQLRKRRGEIANLLLSIENQYKKSLISEKTYTEVKQKNENMMRQIEDEINKLQGGQEFSLKSLPSMIRDLESKSNSLEVRIGEQKRQLDDSLRSMESKLSGYVQESDSKSSQLKDEMEKIESASQSVTKSVEDVNARLAGLVSKTDIEDFKGNVNGMVSSNKDYIDSKVNEFKNEVDRIEGSFQDIKKPLDDMNARLAGFVSMAGIEDFKRNINGMLSSNKDYVDSKVNEIKNETDKIESLQEEMSNSINGVITNLERFASRADISEFKENVSNEVSSNKDYIDSKVNQLKDDVDRIESSFQDIKKPLDDMNARLAGVVSQTDIDNFKKSVKMAISSSKDYIDGKIKEIESSLSLSGSDVKPRIEQLKKRRSDVLNLMLNIEEQYKKALISENTYDEVKQKNESVIKQIENELNRLEKEQGLTLKNLPSTIEDLEDKAKALDDKIDEQEKHIEESLKSMESNSKLASVTQVVKIQTDMLDDVIKKMKEVSDKVSAFSASTNSYELRIKFFEILDGLVRMDNSKEMTYYLTELENLIASMRKSNMWDSRRESMTLSLLNDIAENWRRYGYTETAKAFDDEVAKLKSSESYKYMLKY